MGEITSLSMGNDWAKQFGDLLSEMPEWLFLQVVEQAPIAISVTDLQANICYANQRYSQLTGYSLSELKGKNQRILSSHQTPISLYQELWGCINNGQTWQGRLINRTQAGRDYLAELVIAPVFDQQRQISHFIGIHRDVSESYQLHQALSNQKSQFAAVLNASDNLLVVFDEHYQVILDNLAYKTLRADLDGEEPLVFIRQQLKAQHQSTLETLLTSHQSSIIEYWVRGQKRWLSLTCQPLAQVNEYARHYFSHESQRLYLLNAQDCSAAEQLKVHNYLEQLQGQMSDSKMLSAVRATLQTAAYQLSQPVNMLNAMVRLNGTVKSSSQSLSDVLVSAQQALVTIRASMPQLKPEYPSHFNSAALSDDIALLSLSRARRLAVKTQLSLSVSAKLFACRVRLLSSIDLIVEHGQLAALKAKENDDKHHPKVSVDDVLEKTNWVILIDDNGPRLDKQARHRIMQPFYNRESFKDEIGLALSLARDIIIEHQGTMDVVAIASGGTRIMITLPIDEPVGGTHEPY